MSNDISTRSRFCVLYDLEICPTTFDFVFFLAIAAIKAKGAPLHLVLSPPAQRFTGIELAHSFAHNELRYRNIILKLLGMCAWVSSFEVFKKNTRYAEVAYRAVDYPDPSDVNLLGKLAWHEIFRITALSLDKIYKTGFAVPSLGFTANAELKEFYKKQFFRKSIVFHPRRSNYNTARNTPINLYRAVGERLKLVGYDVYIIPDAEDLDNDDWFKTGFQLISSAQFDLEHRLAASESAVLNVCWSGGAMVPLQFSAASFITFGTFNSAGGAVTSKDFFSRKGPVFGEQPPWYSSRTQILDWEDASKLTADYVYGRIVKLLNGWSLSD